MENFKVSQLNAKEGNKAKVLLNKDGTIRLESRKIANIFKMFYSELATNLVKKLLIVPNRFNDGTTKVYLPLIYLTIVIRISVIQDIRRCC